MGKLQWQWAKILNEGCYIAFQPQTALNGEINTDVLGANFFSSLKDALALERRSNGKKSGKIRICRQDGFPVRMEIFEAMKFCWENNPKGETTELPLGTWFWVVEPRNTVNPLRPQCLVVKMRNQLNGTSYFQRDQFGRPCLNVVDVQALVDAGNIDAVCTIDKHVGIMAFEEAIKICYERMS